MSENLNTGWKSEPDVRTVRIEVPTRTYVRAFLAALVVVSAWSLGKVLILLFLSALIAMTLFSGESRLRKHGWKRWMALTLLISALLGAVGSFVFIMIPRVLSQVIDILKRADELRTAALTVAPPALRNSLAHFLDHSPQGLSDIGAHLAAMGGRMMGGFYDTGVVLIVAIYMLIDGPRTYRWLTAYLGPASKRKMDRTVEEVRPVVFAYIVGQIITSTLAGAYVYGAATLLKVPGALTLALLAAIFDILPIIGFILSTVLSAGMALTVSPSAALTMTIAYLAYHLIENYVLIPAIYGNRLKMSTLAVIVSLLFAGALGGIPGMIAALPIVAAYPTLEKIWMRKVIGEDTVEAHQEQLEESEARPTGHSNPVRSH